MAITRRDFLKISTVTGAGVLFGVFDLKPIVAYAQANPPVWTAEALSVGCYCSGGCGLIVGTNTIGTQQYVTYVQGNPDSPINKGALCSKCASSAQLSTIVDDDTGARIPNPGRLTDVKYRAAGATDWTTISWATAISQIAAKVQATRDATFTDIGDGTPDPVGLTVNRCTGIGCLGGSSLNNEAAYLIGKLMRSLGVVYLETQARN
jgi:formate dehydrogenase major subunit